MEKWSYLSCKNYQFSSRTCGQLLRMVAQCCRDLAQGSGTVSTMSHKLLNRSNLLSGAYSSHNDKIMLTEKKQTKDEG